MRKTDGPQGKSMPLHRVTEFHSDIISTNTLICSSAEAVVSNACGITMTQYFILVRLLASNEPVKMSELAQCLLLAQSTVTVALAQLEEKNAVVRIPDEQDLRIVRAALRREGVDIIDQADLSLAKLYKKFCDLLTPEQVDLMLARCLEVVTYYGASRISRGKIRYDTAFFETAQFVCAQIESGTKECGLTIGEYRVLQYLSTTLDGERLSIITQKLAMRLNDVTNISKKLVAKQLANRISDPKDRRATVLEITSEGYSLATETAPVVSGHIRHLHKTEREVLDVHGDISHTFMNNYRQQNSFVN